MLSRTDTIQKCYLASLALVDAYTDFILSRQAMQCAKNTLIFYKNTAAWHVYDLLEPLAERVVVANPITSSRSLREGEADRHGAGKDRHTRSVDLGASIGSKPGAGRVGTAGACSPNAAVAFTAQAIGGNAYADFESYAQWCASPSFEAGAWQTRFNEQNTGWQKDPSLSKIEQFQLGLEMENRKYLEKQIERLSVEVGQIGHQKPWSSGMGYIMSWPGFGMITAITVLAAIGEIERFETPKKLASYSGLTPGLEQRGTKNRGKGITKAGRRELRWPWWKRPGRR